MPQTKSNHQRNKRRKARKNMYDQSFQHINGRSSGSSRYPRNSNNYHDKVRNMNKDWRNIRSQPMQWSNTPPVPGNPRNSIYEPKQGSNSGMKYNRNQHDVNSVANDSHS